MTTEQLINKLFEFTETYIPDVTEIWVQYSKKRELKTRIDIVVFSGKAEEKSLRIPCSIYGLKTKTDDIELEAFNEFKKVLTEKYNL